VCRDRTTSYKIINNSSSNLVSQIKKYHNSNWDHNLNKIHTIRGLHKQEWELHLTLIKLWLDKATVNKWPKNNSTFWCNNYRRSNSSNSNNNNKWWDSLHLWDNNRKWLGRWASVARESVHSNNNNYCNNSSNSSSSKRSTGWWSSQSSNKRMICTMWLHEQYMHFSSNYSILFI